MTHLQLERYPEARGQLTAWMKAGQIKSLTHEYDGVARCGQAFADLFAGKNFGKTLVKV